MGGLRAALSYGNDPGARALDSWTRLYLPPSPGAPTWPRAFRLGAGLFCGAARRLAGTVVVWPIAAFGD
jgi:hypothetical protein